MLTIGSASTSSIPSTRSVSTGEIFVGIRNPTTGVRKQPRFPPEIWSCFERLLFGLDLTTNARERHHGLTNVHIPHGNPEFPDDGAD